MMHHAEKLSVSMDGRGVISAKIQVVFEGKISPLKLGKNSGI